MGVEWEQCEDVAELIGLKTIVNEFVAYEQLGRLKEDGKPSVSLDISKNYQWLFASVAHMS